MFTDDYGQIILNEADLCELYLRDPSRILTNTLVEKVIPISRDLELTNIPQMVEYVESNLSVEEFDAKSQANWLMPDEYKDLDIAKWVLDQCQTDEERQRVGEELLLYLDKNLFPLLQYLKYMVDTLRKNNVVWGVGRGSSVSSYVLYLIGVHKIHSMFYDLDVHEFLR
jgi:DNA polymerase III alpha subunit